MLSEASDSYLPSITSTGPGEAVKWVLRGDLGAAVEKSNLLSLGRLGPGFIVLDLEAIGNLHSSNSTDSK